MIFKVHTLTVFGPSVSGVSVCLSVCLRVRPIPGIHTDTDTRYRYIGIGIGMSKHIGIGMNM